MHSIRRRYQTAIYTNDARLATSGITRSRDLPTLVSRCTPVYTIVCTSYADAGEGRKELVHIYICTMVEERCVSRSIFITCLERRRGGCSSETYESQRTRMQRTIVPAFQPANRNALSTLLSNLGLRRSSGRTIVRFHASSSFTIRKYCSRLKRPWMLYYVRYTRGSLIISSIIFYINICISSCVFEILDERYIVSRLINGRRRWRLSVIFISRKREMKLNWP